MRATRGKATGTALQRTTKLHSTRRNDAANSNADAEDFDELDGDSEAEKDVQVESATGRARGHLHKNTHGVFSMSDRSCRCDTGGYCAVLDYLCLVWVGREKSFGCEEHHTLVLFCDLPRHLHSHHRKAVGTKLKSSRITFAELLDHLAKIFSVDRKQTLAALRIHEERTDILDLLPAPVKCVQCPSCLVWIKLAADQTAPLLNFRLHFSARKGSTQRCPRPGTEYTPEVRWTQRIFSSSLDSSNYPLRFPLSVGWFPPQPSVRIPSAHISSGPPPLPVFRESLLDAEKSQTVPDHIKDVGYDSWFEEIGADPRALLSLIDSPKVLAKSMGMPEKMFEKRLVLVVSVCKNYLVGINRYASSANDQVRDAVTMDST